MADYLVTSFGASPDAVPSVNANAIQQALDAANEAGGGRVTVPAGLYRTGTIRLRSHVEFHLEQGAVLLASEDPADYNKPDEYPENGPCAAEQWTAEHLIIANRVEDVSLTGPGIIDGNSEAFFGEVEILNWVGAWRAGIRWSKDKKRLRPGQLIVFILSKDIRVDGIFVRNSTCWSLFFHGCDNVIVRNYRVKNGCADANTDGIDIDSCRNVTVSDCIIDTGDDAIAIRGNDTRLPQPKACENIVITNCVLAANSAGTRIGVGMGTVRNVEMSNLIFSRTGTGVIVQSSYTKGHEKGVDISFVRIHHCTFRETGEFLSICPGDDHAKASIHDISIQNCRFEAFGNIWIMGSGPQRLKNITLRDCEFVMDPDPKTGKFFVMPKLMYVKNADSVFFRDCKVLNESGEGDPRSPVLSFNDVPDLRIEGCNFPTEQEQAEE